MNMSNLSAEVQRILEDVYRIDPTLRKQEQEVIAAIQHLLSSRPEAVGRPEFYAALKGRLLQMAERSYRKTEPTQSSLFVMSLSFIRKLALPVGAISVAVFALLIAPSLKKTPAGTSFVALGTGSVTTIQNSAFGTLTAGPAFGRGAAGIGMGGGGGLVPQSVAPTPISSDEKIGMIAPPVDVTTYTFANEGDLPSWGETGDVYRRVKGEIQNAALAETLSRAATGLIDFSAMKHLRVQSYTLIQDQPFGSSITIDFLESVASLYQNYASWPHPEAECRDDACYQTFRLKEADIPQDEEVIRIANAYLAENGIARKMYGEPMVNKDWYRVYQESTEKSLMYIPDSMSVVYPLVLDGKRVYDESGNPYGLTVSVNIRHRRVDGVMNVTTNVFERSSYALEQDEKRIRAFISQGGLYGSFYSGAQKTVEVKLGQGEVVLQKTMKVGELGKPMEELFVPALRFPVVEKPKEVWQQYVIIPLAKDILDQQKPLPADVRVMM